MPILVTCECGKQFQAKDENVGRRFNCPNCNREIEVARPEVVSFGEGPIRDYAPTKTSGQAIASLVLGILSLIGCTFFTGIPAIILGAIGLSSIGKSGRRMDGKGLAIAGIVTGSLGLLLALVAIPIMIGLMIPALQTAQKQAERAQCINNLKQIGLAMHNYQAAYGQFPAASTFDAQGKPLLSWRVTILQFLPDQKPLYDQFKQDEPWDGPNNIKLLDQMPEVYLCASADELGIAANRTDYKAIVGAGAIFDSPEGTPLKSITDGTSNTILAVEAVIPVEWTKPDDLPIVGFETMIGSQHPGGFNALMADGSVRFVKSTTASTVIKALSTRNGGEVIPAGSY